MAEMLTCNDVARRLGMNVAYVRRTFMKEMRNFKIGHTRYVREQDFEAWLKRHEEKPRMRVNKGEWKLVGETANGTPIFMEEA